MNFYKAKLSLVILFSLIASFSFSQKRATIKPTIKKFRNDTIVWKQDSLLKKEDFKAKAKGSRLGFSTVGVFMYPSEEGGSLTINVEALFVKSKSYITQYSEYVLKHEQLHFDICELYARMLRKKISELNFKKIKNVGDELNDLYKKNSTKLFKEQEKFDDDTEHGINAAKQKDWAEDIQNRINELEAFKSSVIFVGG